MSLRIDADDRCMCHGDPIEHLAYCEVERAFGHEPCGHQSCQVWPELMGDLRREEGL